MRKLFNNILVPLRINRNTEATIAKAIQFANRMQTDLHLLCVLPYASGKFLRNKRGAESVEGKVFLIAQKKMEQLRFNFSKKLNDGLNLFLHIEFGEAEEVIAAYAGNDQIDLVYVAESRKKFSFGDNAPNASRIARRTNCPVLTLKSHPALQGLKIIVMPVGPSLPVNKIRVAAYLAKQFNASIHLITRERNGLLYDELAYMQKALQLLRDNTDLRVTCKTMTGESLGDMAIQYANTVNAGLIVVDPGAENSLPGMLNRLFSRFVFNESPVPVITVGDSLLT
jgi:nucleotide-binding universal stress UspA family protein